MELRMYSLVLYQLTGIQAGIQSGHANVEYGIKYGFTDRWLDWATNWKTVIVLNGGSSGMLTTAIDALKENNIEHCEFIEPDLYNNTSAVSFLVDERVFNRELYPDFSYKFCNRELFHDELIAIQQPDYLKWIESIGGEQNSFLRRFLKPFRLA